MSRITFTETNLAPGLSSFVIPVIAQVLGSEHVASARNPPEAADIVHACNGRLVYAEACLHQSLNDVVLVSNIGETISESMSRQCWCFREIRHLLLNQMIEMYSRHCIYIKLIHIPKLYQTNKDLIIFCTQKTFVVYYYYTKIAKPRTDRKYDLAVAFR